MRFHAVILLAALSSIVLFSCQKELEDTTSGNGSGGGSGSGSGGGTVSSNYLPLTANTFWKYKDSTTAAIQTNTVTNKTKVINGRTYTAVVNDKSPDSAFMTKDGANYYIYQSATAPSGGSATILMHFLNDTASVGYTWNYNAGNANGAAATIVGKIVERGITVVVEGKTYTNVIHTELKMTYDIMGTLMPATDYHFYTAKGVGIVKIHSLLTLFSANLPYLNSLVDHQIR
jgi:hypothetical protein